MSSLKIVITGGGTGGHVFPAIAIAEEMQRRGYEITYIGSPHGMEAKLVPDRGLKFVTVKSGAVKNQSVLRIFKTFVQLFFAVGWAWKYLGANRPRAVIGVGGYVSVPVGLAAALRGIPLFLQEQNATGGIANRFLGLFARKIFLGFALAEKEFPKQKCVVTGNPLRKEVAREDFPKHEPGAKHLLIMGGSQGAHAINKVIVEKLDEIRARFPDIRILHQTGQKDLESTQAAYREKFDGKAEVVPFISDMAAAYASAAFVIARSGALTVSELISVGRPALLVPFPRKGQNDQITNAYYLEKNGAARVVEQGEDFPKRFWETFVSVFEPARLAEMGANASRLRIGGALATIGDQIDAEINSSRAS